MDSCTTSDLLFFIQSLIFKCPASSLKHFILALHGTREQMHFQTDGHGFVFEPSVSCVHAYAGISGNVDTARQHTSVLAATMAPRSLELVFELVRILCGASCTRMIMSTVGVSRLVALHAKTVDQKWKRRGGSSHIVIARTTMASTLALIAAPALALAFITSCSRACMCENKVCAQSQCVR